jgi:hypothetical protein
MANFCGISIDSSDTKTHEIESTLFPAVPRFRHFVTVNGTGDIVLTAWIDRDTPQLRSQVKWEADNADITSLGWIADRLKAKIPRNRPKGAKIPVRLKIGSDVCSEVVVWIIWSRLKADTNPNKIATMTLDKLGLNPHREEPGLYVAVAGIEWTATILPREIIFDNDRPAIEKQTREVPPGDDLGVASPVHRDATGSEFMGWDMSRQKRRKGFKGNPEKHPPVPMKETTSSDLEQLRPVKDYPANPVEGNDDTKRNEDSNPYDQRDPQLGVVPGLGEKGTLRSADHPSLELSDTNPIFPPGFEEEGYTIRMHWQFREFVRVQLGKKWYRCSDFKPWRYYANIKRRNGKWNADPDRPDTFDLTNKGF